LRFYCGGERGVVPALRQFQGAPGGLDGLIQISRFSTCGGNYGDQSRVGIAGKLVCLAGQFDGLGAIALRGSFPLFWISGVSGVFGLLFDSLLGATLERRGWLNNDAVNFLSTASAAGFALGLLAILPHLGVR